ncbi:hypothetical protein CBS147339_4315 [Penicillium roqueforti]|uniref:uncharacterized protein n=1 Tax=Penicillium roqueforti TaxID=5082 RepID=UPI00190A68B3|nr:uncharacterized protein LCP9604111_8574 [Penicillium roqueforti]KAF9241034.1 hypothetical protein LCP9604111_8574 [Penicillium roqueforti]KAI1829733.1 hypothetical protein CBS147337_9492 [Penicillium roqueforti]KAI2711408.1 hypothetical protein CBS147318_8076 [Penicillium roqueforti]KAI2740704.1 hypothetical protein DTO012A1_5048 [Penicillium roqueforti]KAI2745865.1 hypothetical protein DTO013F2_7384 [Penicillium roqueforti]
MAAYRSGHLVWDKEKVTYWAHGKMVGGPKKMEMEEFYALSRQLGPAGIWVEGMDDYKPEPMYLFFYMPPLQRGYAMHEFIVSIRNPNTWQKNTWQHTVHLNVIEDTGAIAMKIHQSDRLYIERLSGAGLPVTGTTRMGTAAGEVPVDNVVLQVNIFHNDQPLLPRWTDIRACISRGPRNASTGLRLSGLWLHHMLYCLSVPNNSEAIIRNTAMH